MSSGSRTWGIAEYRQVLPPAQSSSWQQSFGNNSPPPLDAVAAVTVVDGVQVHHQQLVFAVFLLHVQRQLSFADFSLDRDVVRFLRQQRVAHKLLRNGGGAFQAAARKVVHERASDARQVNAIVLVESNILGINGGMLDVVGNFVRLNGVALSSWNSASVVVPSPAYITDSCAWLVKAVLSMLGKSSVQPFITRKAP